MSVKGERGRRLFTFLPAIDGRWIQNVFSDRIRIVPPNIISFLNKVGNVKHISTAEGVARWH